MINNKKIYIPSNDELIRLNEIFYRSGVKKQEIFKYMLAKQIELIVSLGGLEYCDSIIKEDTSIASKVIRFIPSDIWCTPLSEDPAFAKRVILSDYPNNNTKHGLDYLNRISSDVYMDSSFIISVLYKLKHILNNNPNYRFTYEESILLNKIFSCNLLDDITIKKEDIARIYRLLTKIEPAYLLKYNIEHINDHERTVLNINYDEFISEAIEEYTSRYGYDEISYKDIANKYDVIENYQNPNTKKLIKFLNDNK